MSERDDKLFKEFWDEKKGYLIHRLEMIARVSDEEEKYAIDEAISVFEITMKHAMVRGTHDGVLQVRETIGLE